MFQKTKYILSVKMWLEYTDKTGISIGLYLWIRAVGPCEETEGCIARASGKLWKSKNAAYLEICDIVGTGRCEFCCKKVTTSRNTNSWKYNSYWNIGLLFSEARKQIKGLWNDLRSCQTKFCLECKCPFTILFAFAPFLHPPILSTLYKRIWILLQFRMTLPL